MIRWDEKMDIISDYRNGMKIREIAKKYQRSRNTIRKIIRGEHKDEITRKRSSKLEPYKDHLRKRWEETGMSAKILHKEIVGMGFEGSYDIVSRFLKGFRKEVSRQSKMTVRYETPPGKQAQMDWKEFSKIKFESGNELKLNIFVMTLGYSRHTFACFTTSMNLETLKCCHMRALEYFGGIPKEVLYDNMATVRDILTREKNQKFIQFANYYQFKVKCCRARRPRTKGKVERFIEYMRTSFLPGRVFEGIEDADSQLMHWLNTEANIRIHATTQNIPAEDLKKELLEMTAITDIRPWQLETKVSRKGNYEGFVRYNNSHYSVGSKGAGKELLIEDNGSHIKVFLGDGTLIVEHERALKSGSTMSKKDHVAEMWKLSLSDANRKEVAQSFVFKENSDDVQTRSLDIYEEVI